MHTPTISIQREAEVTGICKIVPPKGWKPHFAIDLEDDSNTFETRLQRVHELQVCSRTVWSVGISDLHCSVATERRRLLCTTCALFVAVSIVGLTQCDALALQQGRAYGDGRLHNFRSYRAHAAAFKTAWSGGREMTSDEIEQDYWRIVETGLPNVEVRVFVC